MHLTPVRAILYGQIKLVDDTMQPELVDLIVMLHVVIEIEQCLALLELQTGCQ